MTLVCALQANFLEWESNPIKRGKRAKSIKPKAVMINDRISRKFNRQQMDRFILAIAYIAKSKGNCIYFYYPIT